MKNFSIILLLIISYMLITSCAATRHQPELSGTQKQLQLESFDLVWNKIYTTHHDTTFNGVDWHKVKKELRPEMEKTTSISTRA